MINEEYSINIRVFILNHGFAQTDIFFNNCIFFISVKSYFYFVHDSERKCYYAAYHSCAIMCFFYRFVTIKLFESLSVVEKFNVQIGNFTLMSL